MGNVAINEPCSIFVSNGLRACYLRSDKRVSHVTTIPCCRTNFCRKQSNGSLQKDLLVIEKSMVQKLRSGVSKLMLPGGSVLKGLNLFLLDSSSMLEKAVSCKG